MTTITYDAVILAGGRAARLDGASKADLVVDGASLLEHALAASESARRVVVVGPPGLADAFPAAPRISLTREDPPFGGPVAGLAAGLHALPGPAAPWVLLLAVDVPRAADAVALLELAVSRGPVDGAYLLRDGRAQWLVGLYRRAALDGTLAGTEAAGASMRRLVGGLRCTEVPDPAGWSDDIDTPADAARLGATDHRTEGRKMTDLTQWISALESELGLPPGTVDMKAILDLARDAAHAVERPAAPLTTYAVGYAEGLAAAGSLSATAGGGPDAAQKATDLAARWATD